MATQLKLPRRQPSAGQVHASPHQGLSSDPPSSGVRNGSPDQVRSGIGFGTYGTVVHAQDHVTGTAVAIKILHRDDALHQDVHAEERMYDKLLAGCDPHIGLFAQVLGSGEHEGFHCIVFELCDCTLFDVLQGYSGLVPLPTRHVVEMAYQIVKAVQYLHTIDVIHTDIKLDNIALRSQDTVKICWLDPMTGFQEKRVLVRAQICILDLGNAVELQGRGVAHGRVGAQGYRAPEVTLGLPWSYSIDSFGVGCVIAELYLGRQLFDGDIDTDREYIATIERLLGPFPETFAREIESKYPGVFTFEGTKVAVQYPPPCSLLSASDYADAMRRLERVKPLAAQVHDVVLIDLLRKLLAHDATSRISLEAAAKHKYFDTMTRLQWQ
ncbi:kinase-like protein [Trametes sanguinea]|nr:kinase-like protein [Trametes sanguinea]